MGNWEKMKHENPELIVPLRLIYITTKSKFSEISVFELAERLESKYWPMDAICRRLAAADLIKYHAKQCQITDLGIQAVNMKG
jgi:Mn-dependent DtxR family transcriptional regulator